MTDTTIIKPAAHMYCGCSTGIHERDDADGTPEKPWGLTFGRGHLHELGYWEHGCQVCARQHEQLHNVPANTYWPEFPQQDQPRKGQTWQLSFEDNSDNRTTHVAVQKEHGFQYFCRFDSDTIHPQQGIPDEEVKGTYWTTPCVRYGRCYNGASLWQGGFHFIPLQDWNGPATLQELGFDDSKRRDRNTSGQVTQ